MNPFLRYLADKNSARTHTHTHTDRHTPLTTRPDGLRRAGKKAEYANILLCVICLAIELFRKLCLISSRLSV